MLTRKKHAPRPFDRLCRRAYALAMTQEDMARAAGITTVSLRKRLYGEFPFSLDEVYKIANEMGIPDSELHEYFPDRRRIVCSGQ